MVASSAWSGFKSRNRSYAHTGYTVGTALGLGGKFANTTAHQAREREAISLSLAQQRSDGVNPEKGGYDVRYQMVGIEYAERYNVYFPNGPLAARINTMVNRGLAWQSGRVDQDGWINWVGSTRACNREASTGNLLSPGYPFTIRGLAYWGALTHQQSLLDEAQAAHNYLEAFDGDSLCGPKQAPTAATAGQRDKRPRVGGRLNRVRTQDLYE